MNVIQLDTPVNDKKRIINQLGEYSAGNFEVKEKQLSYVHPNKGLIVDNNRRLLYREDTGDVLNVVKSKYKVTQFRDSFKAVENILVNSDLNLAGLKREMDESHNGASAYQVYTLPSHGIDLGNSDVSVLQLYAYTSHDGTWPLQIGVGYKRMLCLNLQVLINNYCLYKSRHTEHLNLDVAVAKISTVLNTMGDTEKQWRKWMDSPISDIAAFNIFAKVAGVHIKKGEHFLDILDGTKSQPLRYMWHQFTTVDRKKLGRNEWAVYNTMTQWATHAQVSQKRSKKNVAAVKINRADKVREVSKSHLLAA